MVIQIGDGGALADRFHLKPVITIIFIVGSAALILLGINSPQFILYSLIAIAGAATIGSQILLYTFVAQFYPTALRSTGLGWASGIGRIGAIIGPVLTGALLSNLTSSPNEFLGDYNSRYSCCACNIYGQSKSLSVAAQTPSTLTLKTRLPSSVNINAPGLAHLLKWIMEFVHRF